MAEEKTVIYMPPKAELIYLDEFELSKLETTFRAASFERRVSTTKARKIADAIMRSQFIDNVIRVAAAPANSSVKYEVIDGQHRLEALRYSREYYGLENYDLVVFCYTGGELREIYRRLNLGKPLTLSDHLKALDTGRVPFFNELKNHCDHYSSTKLKYATVLNWLHYAKSTSIRPVRPIAVDDFMNSIKKVDIKIVNSFVPVLQQIATNSDSPFYRYTILRNFFRVYYENQVPDEKMVELGKVLLKSLKVTELAEKRDTFAMRGIYHYIIDIAAPKVGLKLSKGDVKK